jgi:TolB-like protein
MASARFRQEVDQQIERIIAGGALGASARQAKLLRYLVERELEGSGGRIKAYAIGTEVFGRTASFNPDTDSIVRTEMARLRKALALHNATTGIDDPLRIVLAPGSFRPTFDVRSDKSADGTVTAPGTQESWLSPVPEAPQPTEHEAASGGLRSAEWRGMPFLAHFGLVIGLTLVFVLAVWHQFGRDTTGTVANRSAARLGSTPQPTRHSRPVLTVRPVQPVSEDDPQERQIAQHLTVELVGSLASNSWLSVESLGGSRSAASAEPDYCVTLDSTVDLDEKDATLVVRLRKDTSDAVLWTRRYQTELAPTRPQLSHRLASMANADVGRMFGPLSEIYIAAAIAGASANPGGVGCTMLAYAPLRSISRELIENAERCLMAALPNHQWSPEVHAALALIKLERLDFVPMTDAQVDLLRRQISTHVETARQLASHLLIVRMAMIASDYYGDDQERLRQELEKLIAAEPNNAVASFYYILKTAHALGDWDRAIRHNESAMAVIPEHPRRSRIVALQHALIQNDLPRARYVVDQMSTIRTPRVALTRFATAGLSEDRRRVASERAKLIELGLSDPEDMLLVARNMRVADAARPVIMEGLKRALELVAQR